MTRRALFYVAWEKAREEGAQLARSAARTARKNSWEAVMTENRKTKRVRADKKQHTSDVIHGRSRVASPRLGRLSATQPRLSVARLASLSRPASSSSRHSNDPSTSPQPRLSQTTPMPSQPRVSHTQASSRPSDSAAAAAGPQRPAAVAVPQLGGGSSPPSMSSSPRLMSPATSLAGGSLRTRKPTRPTLNLLLSSSARLY